MVYEDDIKSTVIAQLNKNLNAEVKINPADIDVTFLSSFPKCALNFRNITIMEALTTKQRDTLLQAQNLSLRFSIKDIFSKTYRIQQIWLESGFARLKVSKDGQENYLIWKTDSSKVSSGNSAFSLESIVIRDLELSYKNKPQNLFCKLKLREVAFSGNFNTDDYAMESRLKGAIELLKVNNRTLLQNKSLKLDAALDIQKTYYVIKKAEAQLNTMRFNSTGHFNWDKTCDNMMINYKGVNLDIATVLSLLPENEQQRVKDYSSNGEFYASGTLRYTKKAFTCANSFGIKNATVTYKPKSATLTNVNLIGTLDITEKESRLECKNISANYDSNQFTGQIVLNNFQNPYLNLNANIQSDLKSLMQIYPIDTITSMNGNLKADVRIKGLISELQKGKPSSDAVFEGQIELTDAKLQFKQDKKEYTVPLLKLEAKDNSVTIPEFNFKRGSSDISLSGKLPGFMKYVFTKEAPLDIVASLKSEQLDLDDFLSASSETGKQSEILFPENNHFVFDADIKKFKFGKFSAEGANGNIELRSNKVLLSDLRFETADGKAEVDALAEFKNGFIYFDMQALLAGLNVTKLFQQLNNFGQTTLKDEHIKGFLTADISCSARWDKFLKPDLNSLQANAKLAFERGELNNFKPLESLSRFVEINELKQIKFSTLESEITIKEQAIIIPKTALKNSALNIEFWGTHKFNNDIDYHIQLLLSELITRRQQKSKALDDELAQVEMDPDNRRSVFVLMTGNIDKPIIRYDRKGAKQKIKEDIKQEKQNLKAILKEEFGLFKKDSVKTTKPATNPGFKLEKPTNKQTPAKPKEEEEEDF